MGRAWPLGVDVLSAKLLGRCFEIEFASIVRPGTSAPALKSVTMALADHAHHDGSSVYPSVKTIAWMSDLSERTVQRCLAVLEEARIITPTDGREGGRGKTTEWILDLSVLPEKLVAKGRHGGTVSAERVPREAVKGATAMAPEPKNQVLEKTSSSPGGAEIVKIEARRRDPVWDALAEMFGNPSSREGEKRRGKCRAALIAAGVTTADQVGQMAAEYRATFSPEIVITAEALSKHADQLLHRIRQRGEAKAKAAQVFCEWCGHRDGAHADDCVRPRAVA